MTTPTAGVLADRFPYVRFGSGARTIVILPGMGLDNEPPGALLSRGYAHAFGRLAAAHTVYIVHRGHGLAAGSSTQDIAADYARLLGPEIGPFTAVGMSTGGLVAQYLAIGRPDLVVRVVLVLAGARIAPAGLDRVRRWRGFAEAGRWRTLRGDLAASAVDSHSHSPPRRLRHRRGPRNLTRHHIRV